MQLTLDFSKPSVSVDPGKKTERITFTGSEDLKDFLNMFSLKQNTSVSEFCQKYIIEGLQRDLGTSLLTQANQSKTLAELVKRS
jgi:exoribonuclease R